MNTHLKIFFIGGDPRQHTAAKKIADSGRFVSFFGGNFERYEKINYCSDLSEGVEDAKIVVLPLPSTVDGVHVNMPFFDGEQVSLSRLAEILPKNALTVGGKIPSGFVNLLEERGIRVIDYFLSEEFQIKNAYTTAEAALCIAMNNLKKNIRDSRFAITGYGRISKSLCELLLKFGASVCVLARKESDLAWSRLWGARAQKIDERSIDSLKTGYDVIFNTVPKLLFGEEFLAGMSEKTQIVDLASSPGGVDISAAKKLGANVLWASSLPGKYAPESAGELISDCIKGIVSEVGE